MRLIRHGGLQEGIRSATNTTSKLIRSEVKTPPWVNITPPRIFNKGKWRASGKFWINQLANCSLYSVTYKSNIASKLFPRFNWIIKTHQIFWKHFFKLRTESQSFCIFRVFLRLKRKEIHIFLYFSIFWDFKRKKEKKQIFVFFGFSSVLDERKR